MKRFLIVDDNVAFAENLAEIIGDNGDEAVVASSGSQALELCAGTRSTRWFRTCACPR